jgi:hypothetical protein
MTELDYNRAAFVQAEYRYAQQDDHSIKAVYDDARELTVDASINDATAEELAAAYLAEFGVFKRTFEVDWTGEFSGDDLVGSLPRYDLDGTNVGKAVRIVEDSATGVITTTLRVG